MRTLIITQIWASLPDVLLCPVCSMSAQWSLMALLGWRKGLMWGKQEWAEVSLAGLDGAH